MSWRTVVIASRAKLELQLNYLVIRGEETRKIHLSEISILILESTQISITAALLAELVRKKIKVIFCDEKRNPSAELNGYYGAYDTSRKLREQIAWSEYVKGLVWTEIVRAKIFAQQSLLRIVGRAEKKVLAGYIEEMTFNDETNREGHAAKVYFNALFGKSFSREKISPINAALNYGYAVLLSLCNREIVSEGYITQIGLHHNNIFNSFNFGSDLMEPLRPFVDRVVFEMWKNDVLGCFGTEEKHLVLNFLSTQVLFAGKKNVLSYAAGLYCKSVFAAINEKDISCLQFCCFVNDGEGNEL